MDKQSRKRVFLIAPSSAVEKQLLQKALTLLHTQQFQVDYQPDITEAELLFAGSSARRGTELLSQLTSKETHILWCARGGTGSNELLPEISQALKRGIQIPQKYFVGFSDITPIQNLLALQTSTRVIYGLAAAIPDFGKMPPACWTWFKTLLTQDEGRVKTSCQFFKGHQLEGRLVGGNLSLLLSVLGTPYDFSYDEKILFLEDVNEPFHRVARGLLQLQQSGKLQKVKGLVFGKFNIRTCIEEELFLTPMLDYFFKKVPFPIVYNFPCGHIYNCIALPLNTPVRFEAEQFSFTWGE